MNKIHYLHVAKQRRRLLVAFGVGALAAPLASFAQLPPAKIPRIGFLGLGFARNPRGLEAFGAGMRKLGYVEGKNFVIEFRWAEEQYERLPALAAELVRSPVDVIVTASTPPGIRAAKQATTTIPIVIGNVGDDPVVSGLVASLARPGGNITGSTYMNVDLSTKRLELLKETVPRIQQVAVLLNPDGYNESTLQAMQIAAKSLGLELLPFYVRGPTEFESAFSAMSKSRIDAITIYSDTMLTANARPLAALAASRRLPGIGGISGFAEAGVLMSYGVNSLSGHRRAAYFVDRILKGAKPGELPIEQATKFELVVNMKTAKALGLTIPQTVLVRADRVIE